jgi:hypothetical protein
VPESVPASLVVTALDEIVRRVGATEVTGAGGGPFRSLEAVDGSGPAGRVRVWTSEAVPRIVYTNLDLPAHDMDSHMFYAFAPADSGVPHFTLDAVSARGIYAFHADLMPRVDLATHLPYMDAVFTPLDETQRAVEADAAFKPAVVPSRGRAMMSPWMLANRLDETDFPSASPPSHFYLDYWLGLVERGLSSEVVASLADVDLAERDAALRHNLFGQDIDPAWDMAAKIVGADAVSTIRAQLIGD